jgi:hypothetical protein
MSELKELSPALVGKVNKARTLDDKKSKTPEGDKTRSIAVRKAWLKAKVGVVKEDGEAPTNHAGTATSTSDVHWSKKQPKVGLKGKIKKYGQPMAFKAIIRRKGIAEATVYYKLLGQDKKKVSRTSANGGGPDGSTGSSDASEHIVKVGSQYRLVSKASGKNLGTYPSKAGAEKRERQVQYFKHQG